MTTLRRLKDVVALEQFGIVLTKAESLAEIVQLHPVGIPPRGKNETAW